MSSHFELIAALLSLSMHALDKTSREIFHVGRRYPTTTFTHLTRGRRIISNFEKQVIDIIELSFRILT